MRHNRTIFAGILTFAVVTSKLLAVEVGPLYQNGFPNQFFDGPITITSGVFEDNAIRIFTIDEIVSGNPEDHKGGGGFVIAVSNGENGIDVGAGVGEFGGPNVDDPNPTPVGAAIDIINGGDGTMGNRIQNGNAFRFSVWVRHDPTNPVTVETSVEPVLKFELWSEAQSIYADYEGRKPSAAYGDRLWDTDLNAPDPFFAGFGQSLASHIDINDNGSVVDWSGDIVSIGPTDNWTRVETTIVIDDDPDDSGFGWDIAAQGFDVSAIEEVRATFFTGDFSGDSFPLADGGRFFVDNALLEAFPDEATMLATPNPNPMPTAPLIGDYNDNGTVDAADYVVWRKHLGGSAAALANRDPSITGLVKPADYNAWRSRFGNSTAGSGSVMLLAYGPRHAAPEPSALLLLLTISTATSIVWRWRRVDTSGR